MSKVYSFRLDENNPREAQAREVIEAWVEEGYSLRYAVVEALITYKKMEAGHTCEADRLCLITWCMPSHLMLVSRICHAKACRSP